MSNYETNPVGALQVKLFMMMVVMIMIMKILVMIFLVVIILIISGEIPISRDPSPIPGCTG